MPRHPARLHVVRSKRKNQVDAEKDFDAEKHRHADILGTVDQHMAKLPNAEKNREYDLDPEKEVRFHFD
jgi:hypothetical protein